jgi:hypothetical protein
MKRIIFPDSFEKRPHLFLTGVTHWRYIMPDDSPLIEQTGIAAGQPMLSVIDGYSAEINGKPYELNDFSQDDTLRFFTKEELNEYLNKFNH